MKNALIIHGAYGSPKENWFTWLKVGLKKFDLLLNKIKKYESATKKTRN